MISKALLYAKFISNIFSFLGDYLDLRRHHLAYTDLVSGDREIIFTLLNKPTSGNLTKLVEGIYITLQKGDTFTQQDINDKLIRY